MRAPLPFAARSSHAPSLVKAKQPQGEKAPGKDLAELIAIQEQAQAEGKGVRFPALAVTTSLKM